MSFELILHKEPEFDTDHRRGSCFYMTNNVMQAECKFTQYKKYIRSGTDVLTKGKSLVLLHNGNIRREYRNPANEVQS